jgi:hypothetical protein
VTDSPVEKSTRLQAWRGETRKILRDKLKAESAIDDLDMVSATVKAKWEELSAPQVGALKLLADNAWRKLAKVLPDVKAVEHDVGENAEKLTRDVLNERLAAIQSRANRRIDGRGSEGSAGDHDGTGATH